VQDVRGLALYRCCDDERGATTASRDMAFLKSIFQNSKFNESPNLKTTTCNTVVRHTKKPGRKDIPPRV
jgi:hypothetical protein